MEYYGSWARDQLMKINGWMPGDVDPDALYVHLYDDQRWLRRLLEQFPQADADGDGIITAEDAVRWHAKRVMPLTPGSDDLEWLPDDVSHWKEVLRMRDGVGLALQVYLPAGEGPFPVMICRGHRRRAQMDGAHWYLARGFACVSQDIVPEGEALSVGAHGARAVNPGAARDVGADTLDLIEWVSRQPWCNGKTAIFGYSAGGMATLPALSSKPDGLTATITHITSTDAGVYRSRGGVAPDRRPRREQDEPWSPGTPPDHDRLTLLPTVGPDDGVGIFRTDIAGWFDIFVQGSIDDWLAWRSTGRCVLVIGAGSHGPHPRPSRVPPDYCDSDIFWPDVPQFNLLNGGVDWASVKSVICYFLMGDFTNPDAPGNCWKVTEQWPVPHEPRRLFLRDAGGLTSEPPTAAASVDYAYDPNDPVERVDIGWRSLIADGPVDQRPLHERSDVLFFTGEPLTEPLEITGRISARLFVETDVPDTTFMVKLLDVYPDGYEAMIAHGVLMARYRDGFASPTPMQPHTVYALTVDLWSTAIVLDAGHRIGVFVTSSDFGRFAVHPNTWAPVSTYRDAIVAHTRIHLSPAHPSSIDLPVVKPGASTDYNPALHRLCEKTAAWDT